MDVLVPPTGVDVLVPPTGAVELLDEPMLSGFVYCEAPSPPPLPMVTDPSSAIFTNAASRALPRGDVLS